MQRIYISDTNIWSHFRHGGLLEELFALPFAFASTDFVLNELPEGEPEQLKALGLVVETLEGEAAYSTDRGHPFQADRGQCSRRSRTP